KEKKLFTNCGFCGFIRDAEDRAQVRIPALSLLFMYICIKIQKLCIFTPCPPRQGGKFMAFFQNLWEELSSEFVSTFIEQQRYLLFLNGLKTTLIVAFAAAALGVVLVFIIAYIRTTHDQTGHLRILNRLCKLYLTVIRGTPTMIQLLIMYFIVFGSVNVGKVPVAILAFGINSGAYVAEIFRSGIMSLPPGQMEAARSLGLNYTQATWKIILPQAVKNVLPALGNEL